MDPQERRSQILGEAARLFGDNGYHATSISDIIQSAGIARGTFYLYFDNKRAIFEELVDLLLERLDRAIRLVDTGPGAPSARRQLLDNLQRVIELLTEERSLLSILLEGAVGLDRAFDDKLAEFYDRVTRAIESSLSLGREFGLVRPCDTRVVSLAVLGGLKEVLHDLLRAAPGERRDRAALAESILDLFSRGVLVEGASIL
ncbi:MAG TPA: TetR/AcrR family transcriptional regulator [Polyangia bacterium]|nr:TetR/AcrR family transcriptional regulator [Polyangia bacterium]